MKYWNKSKEVRLRCWSLVTIPYNHHDDSKWIAIRKWCRELNGNEGKYFSPPYKRDEWWFENSEDALVFKLQWI